MQVVVYSHFKCTYLSSYCQVYCIKYLDVLDKNMKILEVFTLYY